MDENTALSEIELAKAAAKALEDKKGVDISILEVSSKTVITDYFVLATGTSSTHVNALADEVQFALKTAYNLKPSHVEGHDSWVLIDFGTIIVHVFTQEARSYYNLEKLWKDAETLAI